MKAVAMPGTELPRHVQQYILSYMHLRLGSIVIQQLAMAVKQDF